MYSEAIRVREAFKPMLRNRRKQRIRENPKKKLRWGPEVIHDTKHIERDKTLSKEDETAQESDTTEE